MALKLGELVAYLSLDKENFRDGLAEGKRDLRAAGRDLEREADATGKAMAAALGAGGAGGADRFVRDAAGRLRDERGRFAGGGSGGGGGLAGEAVGLGVKIGVSTSKGIFAALDVSLKSLPPHVQTALAVGMAGAAVAATPFIAAALTGAIGGAVGAGAIAAGIASASQSPQVKAAWQELADDATDVFAEFGMPFVAPTVEAIGIIRGGLADVRGDLAAIADDASRFVGPTARGLVGFLSEVVRGARDLVAEADPIFDMFEDELPRLGRDVRDFFDSLGDGAEGGAEGLRALLRVAGFTLRATGKELEYLSNALEGAAWWAERLGGALNFVVDDGQTKKIKGRGEALDDVAGAANDVAWSVKGMSDAFSDWLGLSLSAEEAADRFKLSLYELDDAVEENGRSLSDSTEGGLRNQQVIRDMIQLADRQRQAEIDRAGGTEEAVARANAAYDANIRQIIEVGVKAGLSRAELEKLAGSYGIHIYMTGLEAIQRQLRALASAASVVPGLAGASIAFHLAEGIIAGALSAQARAAGGPTIAGQAYWVGEQGPELWVAPANGRVIPHGESVAAVSRPAVTGGSDMAARSSGADADTIARAVRAALSDMSVQLDGYAVGRVQAQTADLMYRAEF